MIFKKDNGAVEAGVHGMARDPRWGGTRKSFLVTNPYCKADKPPSKIHHKILHAVTTAVGIRSVQVHHIIPFHFCKLLGRPELELDFRNLITLCESGSNHHLILGHLNCFTTFNPSVITFAVKYAGLDGSRIKADPYYVAALNARPKSWAQMSDAEKQGLRELMDKLYPVAA